MTQRIFVTGGSSGIGEGIVRRLGREGASVGIGYHSGEDEAKRIAAAVEEDGGKGLPIGGNVGDADDVAAAFAAMNKAFGGVDGVVINAGVQADADAEDMSADQWRKVMSVDLDGSFFCAREAIRAFQKKKRLEGGIVGRIVFVTSVHAFIPWAGHVNYAAAKGGAEMLMKSLAQEVASDGIKVNAVAPGAIKTPINEDVWSDEEKLEKLLQIIPNGRLGETEDVAAAVSWLLSKESDYVTGVSLIVDGGMSLYPGFIGNG
ncbi:SDR family oxidoreductase [Parvularcula maris]|uniref:SDR family oxidoreductase n=1 Tax=Parvularcula maris TaxID=2965077 RepID=A0A9X2LB20_9PROT|nr:SDR family oxidoreductase [Parvularcula maris]MCQ8186208.1 SDR family oxidoreductase [Parvularcula maris]